MALYDRFIKESAHYFEKWRISPPEYISLAGADLRSVDLSEAHLDLVDFERANLEGVCFRQASLRLSNFREANLRDADLVGATLYGASLEKACLDRADLSSARLSLADFSEASMKESKIAGGQAVAARFVKCKAAKGDFSESDLTNATFISGDFSGASFKKANLNKSNLTDANLISATLEEADLEDAILTNANLLRADLRHSSLKNVKLDLANARDTLIFYEDLVNARFLSSQLTDGSLLVSRQHRIKIFISYSHQDAGFALRLEAALRERNVDVWIDRRELMVGDSLIEKISEGVSAAQFVCAVLSSHSIKSRWVQVELEMAINEQIASSQVKILPIVLEEGIKLPHFLVGRVNIDFSLEENFDHGVQQIMRRVNRSIDLSSVAPVSRVAYEATGRAQNQGVAADGQGRR